MNSPKQARCSRSWWTTTFLVLRAFHNPSAIISLCTLSSQGVRFSFSTSSHAPASVQSPGISSAAHLHHTAYGAVQVSLPTGLVVLCSFAACRPFLVPSKGDILTLEEGTFLLLTN